MKTISHPPRLARLRLALLLCLFGSAMAVQAATFYWQGNGNTTATRQWPTLVNWSPNATGGGTTTLPNFSAPGDDLVFGTYVATQNTLNSRPTNSLWAHSMTFTCNGWLIVIVNSSSDRIILGAGGITNNVGNVTGTDTANNVPNPPINEFRGQMVLGTNATIWNMDTNQPIKYRTLDALTANPFLNISNFTLTLDGPGTNSFSTPAGTHYGGNIIGTGGVIKNGSGSTVMSASNTYTGPTIVNAGNFTVKTWSIGGGSYTVADGAQLQVSVGSVGTTFNTSSLNLTNTTGALNTNTLAIALGSFGNPAVPVVHATNLTLNGTVYLTVTGSGLSPGTIPLIQYDGNIAGGGTLVTNAIPAGVAAYLTNNTGAKQWQLVVSSVPALVWTGKTNATLVGVWDIGVTTNWTDTTASQPASFANGLPVLFNDTGFTNVITLATNVVPFSITVSNNAKTYTLTNDGVNGFQANPSGGLHKDGPGLFILGTTNSYTSFTSIRQGTLRTAIANAIGRGTGNSGAVLTNNATLDLNGFSQNIGALYGSGVITNSSSQPVVLQSWANDVDGGTFTGRIDEGSGGAIRLNKSGGELTMSGANNYSGGTYIITGGAAATRWIILGGDNVLGTGPLVFKVNGVLTPDASPRTLTNTLSIQSANSSFTLGNTGAGLLTCSGPIVNSSGLDETIICPSDVVFTSPFTSSSGGFTGKEGPGTLRLLNTANTFLQLANDSRVNDGSLIIDGGTVSVIGANNPNFRVQSQVANGTASLFITNGGSLAVGNANGYYRLRLGDTSSPSGSTNIVDVRGTLIADAVTMGYSNTNNAGGGALARLNLQSGSQVTLNQISPPSTNCRAITEVNLDGATINAFDTASSSFLQGMTNVFIKSGGVTLNGSNTNSIHIRQNLLSGGGSGGLTWNGTNSAVPTATTLQLDGASTYTGTTLINVGSLGGSGTLAGPLVMVGGSSLLPGGGGNIGTFTVNNNVTLNSGVHGSFELNTTNYLLNANTTNEFGAITNYVLLATNDMLVVSGTLSVSGATLTVNNDGTNLVLGSYFKLFNQAAVGFTSVSLPALDAGLAWQNNLAVDGSIQVVVAVVTPPPLNFSQAGNVLTFTWTNASFHLQSQTNTLGVGLSTNWSDHPGGGASGVGVTNDPANPTVFFRLKNP